jgi:TonB family protein
MNILFTIDFWIAYMLPSSVAVAAFYLFYKLIVQNDTHLNMRRFAILGCLIFAMVLPFLNFQISVNTGTTGFVGTLLTRSVQNELPMFAVYADAVETHNYASLQSVWKTIGGIYLTIVAFLLIYGFVGILRLVVFSRGGFENLSHLSHRSPDISVTSSASVTEIPEKQIIVSPKIPTAFSFFTTIFMPETLYNSDEKEMLLHHERVHVQQKHSWDLVLMNLICVIQFFNPFVWLLRREMLLNHEFLADRGALKNCDDATLYFELLLQKTTMPLTTPTFAPQMPPLQRRGMASPQSIARTANFATPHLHRFHYSPLKHRIMMQITKPAKMLNQVRYLAFIPLALALTFLFACQGKSTFEEVNDLLTDKKELAPLIFVDGEIFHGGMDSLNSLNPNDIMSINILKDSASLALYGQSKKDYSSVIVVTTKKATKAQLEADEVVKVYVEAKNSDDNREIFSIVEDPPQFPGGEEARIAFLRDNIRYPKEAREKNIQGTVFVKFVVEKDGRITNVEVVRGIGGGADEETVRVIEMMPNWIPGKQRGQNVRVQFTMPLRFALSGEDQSNNQPVEGAINITGYR